MYGNIDTIDAGDAFGFGISSLPRKEAGEAKREKNHEKGIGNLSGIHLRIRSYGMRRRGRQQHYHKHYHKHRTDNR